MSLTVDQLNARYLIALAIYARQTDRQPDRIPVECIQKVLEIAEPEMDPKERRQVRYCYESMHHRAAHIDSLYLAEEVLLYRQLCEEAGK